MILEKRQRSPESFLKESCIVSVDPTRISTLTYSFMEIWGQQRSEESSACGAMQSSTREHAKLWGLEVKRHQKRRHQLFS